MSNFKGAMLNFGSSWLATETPDIVATVTMRIYGGAMLAEAVGPWMTPLEGEGEDGTCGLCLIISMRSLRCPRAAWSAKRRMAVLEEGVDSFHSSAAGAPAAQRWSPQPHKYRAAVGSLRSCWCQQSDAATATGTHRSSHQGLAKEAIWSGIVILSLRIFESFRSFWTGSARHGCLAGQCPTWMSCGACWIPIGHARNPCRALLETLDQIESRRARKLLERLLLPDANSSI